MIIWGWGKVTRKAIGQVYQRTCSYCNRTEIWQLYLIRTWFTLFFIPIIPYSRKYCIACPSCGSYVELTKEQFEQIKHDITGAANGANSQNVEDSLRYAGKTETQINYLKQMEEANKQVNQ